jgi:spore germination cell wall hydrolase CwlJ-like protein
MIRIIKIILSVVGISLVGLIAYEGINYKLEQLKAAEAQVTTSPVTAEVRDKQLDCLAKNIYHEAKGEPFEGKVAVAQVTINRAASGQFPGDICKVVYQKNIVYDKVLCQFSWYCEQATAAKPKNTAAYKECQIVARQVLLEEFRLPSLNKALYFHATHINPGWKREKVATIGGHVFYK